MARTSDAARGVKFKITAGDIRRAKSKDPERCAAALALKRQFGAGKVEVHAARTYVEVGGRRRRFATPAALKMETVVLDRGGAFEPGEYVLRPIPQSQKAPATRKRAAAFRQGTKKPKARDPRRATPNVRRRAPHGRPRA
jgi:hypothetical protein